MTGAAESVRYRFSDATRAGVLLGLSLRQAMPLVVGIGWLTLWLAAGHPVVGVCGVVAGLPGALGALSGACLLAHLAQQLRLLVGGTLAVEVAVRTVVLPFGAGQLLALAAAHAHGVVDVLAHGFSRNDVE